MRSIWYNDAMNNILKHRNIMRKSSYIFLIAVLVCILLLISGCGFSGSGDLAGLSEKEDEWMNRPTGSAEYFDSNTVLVSIYMDSDGSSSRGWSDEDIARTRDYLDMATDYLTSAGEDYGCDVKLTYDISDGSDLMYFTDMDVLGDDADDIKTHDTTDNWIESNIDYPALMEKYDTDSIGFLYFMNAGGTSWCYPYYPDPDYPEYGYLEKCYLYLYDEYGEEYENPATYTHEILHMFGAADLYTVSEEDGVSNEVISYVDKTYPRDIMYTVYDENEEHDYDEIPCEIGPITAYFIGFVDRCDELAIFPELKRRSKASFPEYVT